MKLGQGNIFRSVCQEFCPRGGYLVWSRGRGVYLVWSQGGVPGRPPPDQVHPPSDQVQPPPPDQVHTPPDQVHPPWTRYTPTDQVHPPPRPGTPPPTRYTPPDQVQPPRYGQRAAGTHPTGMHSCLQFVLHWLVNLFTPTERECANKIT